jgi:hypothetical protein
MSYEIAYVPKGQLCYAIPAILPYMHKSEDKSKGRSTVDDILAFLLDGSMFLFVVYDPQTRNVFGYTIGKIRHYPQFKMLSMKYAAGEVGVMEQVEDQMHAFVESFAKAGECAGIEFVGRPGWKRTMERNGYSADTIVYEKFFGETST